MRSEAVEEVPGGRRPRTGLRCRTDWRSGAASGSGSENRGQEPPGRHGGGVDDRDFGERVRDGDEEKMSARVCVKWGYNLERERGRVEWLFIFTFLLLLILIFTVFQHILLHRGIVSVLGF